MKRPHRPVAIAATLACYLVCAFVQAEDSVYQRTQQLALNAPQEFDDFSVEQETYHTPINFSERNYQSELPHTNWQFGVEFLLYDLKYGSVNFQNSDGDDDVAGGLRLNFGWESDNGYGIRARVAGVHGEGNADARRYYAGGSSTLRGTDFRGASPFDAGSQTVEVTTSTSSIDIFKHAQYDRYDILFGAGLSGAGMFFDIPAEAIDNSLVAGGASLFTEGKYLISHSEVSELSLVGSGRVSFLTGEWENIDTNSFYQRDSDLTITEAAVGLEWKRKLGRSVLNLRAQYEHQLWNPDVTSDLVFNGAALRAGITW